VDQYYDAIKKKERDSAIDSAKKTAFTSGIWGGALGGMDAMLYGQRSVPKILLRGLGTGLMAGGIGGGASLLGDELLGPANPNDPSAHTKESALGGALGGAGIGAGAGYLMGTGKLSGLAHLPRAGAIGKAAHAALPLDNLVVDWIKKKMRHPSSNSGLALAAGLGLLGGTLGGVHGAEAGMDRDLAAHLGEEDEPSRYPAQYAG
jgi:hypothetical protein